MKLKGVRNRFSGLELDTEQLPGAVAFAADLAQAK